MAATIDLSCPKCGNKSKAPQHLAGKKIRCKQCQNVFVVEAAGAKAGAAKSTYAKPTHDDAEVDKNPYIVKDEILAARCPFCAIALDPPDSRICLHCGYDMQKRRRVESKAVYDRDATDYLLYHLVTVGCVITIIVLLAIDVVFLILRNPIMKDSWFDNGDGTYLVKPGIIPLYVFLASLLGIVPCVRITFRRLINFKPPEVEKKVEKDVAKRSDQKGAKSAAVMIKLDPDFVDDASEADVDALINDFAAELVRAGFEQNAFKMSIDEDNGAIVVNLTLKGDEELDSVNLLKNKVRRVWKAFQPEEEDE